MAHQLSLTHMQVLLPAAHQVLIPLDAQHLKISAVGVPSIIIFPASITNTLVCTYYFFHIMSYKNNCHVFFFIKFMKYMISLLFVRMGQALLSVHQVLMHFGFIATIPAIATLCFCPPESLLGEAFLKLIHANCLKALFYSFPYFFCWNTYIFWTESLPLHLLSVPTNLIIRILKYHTSSLSYLSSDFIMLPLYPCHLPTQYPLLAITSALKCFASVDLPEPLCPKYCYKMLLLCISILTLSTAVVIPSTFPSSSRLIYSNVKSFVLYYSH